MSMSMSKSMVLSPSMAMSKSNPIAMPKEELMSTFIDVGNDNGTDTTTGTEHQSSSPCPGNVKDHFVSIYVHVDVHVQVTVRGTGRSDDIVIGN